MALVASGKFKGERLRELRVARSWSQSKLARKIGAHATSVSDWERGDNAPSGRYVAALAREFGVQAEHFYDDGEAEAARMAPLAADTSANLAAALQAAVGAAVAAHFSESESRPA